MHIQFDNETQSPVLVAFVGQVDGQLTFSPPAVKLDKTCKGRLLQAAQAARHSGAMGKTVLVYAPKDGVSLVLLVGVGDLSKADGEAIEKGTAFAIKQLLTSGHESACILLSGWKKVATAHNAARAGFGALMASYRFDRYRTQLKPEQKASLTNVMIDVADGAGEWAAHNALAEGVSFARNLVNEPANILHPVSFAARLRELTDLGVEVSVLGEADMKALGMHALLGVGLGSPIESQLVVMQWRGGGEEAPLAFVGKGVCFDTGGVSLKPAGGMEDMKGDMGGAAAVSGAMKALAMRKAKANVIGVVGLVENMNDGLAQRPGDIVVSMSGQTIEVLNTDAEGRLVLCDAMTYVQKTFKPKALVDLATLTGAIIISLGNEYAGLFSNSDDLSAKITKAGAAAGEPVWRLPQAPAYNKLLDSPVADMKNVQRSGPGAGAGSITAAQFLGRFVEDGVDWAHIDIAGTAWKPSNDDPREPSWGTGFGVRLLNKLVEDYYENQN
jgi:leucyl aminopeptidase